jgi:glycosyltransferase involved in cell wall biosynthesis
MRHALKYFKQMPDEKLFDICLANFALPGGAVARYIQKRWGIPYVILSHGHDIPWFSPKQMFFWHLALYPIIKNITTKSLKNVLLTPELKQVADNFLGKRKASSNMVIPNGLLVDRFREGFDTPDEPLKILFVGRMVAQKDPLTFVKACKIINDLKIPAHFTMVGDGPLKESVEKLILKLGIMNIELLGKVSQYQVYHEYENSHLLVLPSREEAMSMVVLEAVSRGIYVITTPVSGNNELIKEGINGNLVPIDQPKEVAEQIVRFYNEKYLLSYKYPVELVDFLYDKYSWDSVVDKYLELFKSGISE